VSRTIVQAESHSPSTIHTAGFVVPVDVLTDHAATPLTARPSPQFPFSEKAAGNRAARMLRYLAYLTALLGKFVLA